MGELKRRENVAVYGADMSPPCSAALVALKLAAVEFNYIKMNLKKGENMKPAFIAINPKHTVPTIVDNELILYESRAIIQYAFNKYAPTSPLYPTEPKARAKVDALLQYDLGTFFAAVSKYIYNSIGLAYGPRNDPLEKRAFWEQVDFIENHLISGKYLTGDTMTIADINLAMSMSMPMVYLGSGCYKKYPKISAWREEMMQCTEFADQYRLFRSGQKILEKTIMQYFLRFLQWIKS